MRELKTYANITSEQLKNNNNGKYKNAVVKVISDKTSDSKIYLLYVNNILILGKYSHYDTLYLQRYYFLDDYKKYIYSFIKSFCKFSPRQTTKKSTVFNIDFISVLDSSNDKPFIAFASYSNYYTSTSKDNKRFFKGFNGYHERTTNDTNGKYLLTRSDYGTANHLYFYVDKIGG